MTTKDRIILAIALTVIGSLMLYGLERGNFGGAIILGGTTWMMLHMMYGHELQS